MSYSEAAIIGDPTIRISGRELAVSWLSSAPAGTWYQVYVNRNLVTWTQALSVRLAMPTGTVYVNVGTVLPAEVGTDFSASLPAIPLTRIELDWDGGAWEGDNIVGWWIFQSPPNGAVDLAGTPVGNVFLTVAGVDISGFGVGGFGVGGFGSSSGRYTWTSDTLESGTYTWAVQPYDPAGNANPSPLMVSATIAAPPIEPAADATGARLRYTLDGSRKPTLFWLASPSSH